MSGWNPRVWLIVWCGIAIVLRLAVMWAEPDQLVQDRDLYLGLAQELRAGHGYATPGSDPPRATAFRPPLYPMMLAITGPNPRLIGGLHLLLAASMVTAVGLASYRICRGHWLWRLAPVIVAVDPLLLLYSRQPMTETLCACLSAVLIWRVACREQTGLTGKAACGDGVVWGLCLLARPTYGAAMAVWLLMEVICGRKDVHQGGTEARSESRESRWSTVCHLALVLTIALLTVSPWAVRNWIVFGRPIVTTTHGGYTLLLANNAVYLKAGEESFGVFDGKSLSIFQKANDQLLDEEGVWGEVARDRAMSRMAWQFIGSHPRWFVRACLFRARTFWAITPSRTGENGQNLPILWAVGGYYLTLWVGGIAALVRGIRRRSLLTDPGFLTAISLVLGFFLVHLVYWTDVRMRAPVMPAVAVITAAAWGLTGRSRTPDT